MYSLMTVIFLIGVLMLAAGFLGRLGTNGLADVSRNVAGSFALIFTYAILVAAAGSMTELSGYLENFLGGVPFMSDIADYGSFRKLLSEARPMEIAVDFMDTVILSAVIEIVMLLPLGQNNKKHFFSNRGNLMINLFVAFLAAIAGVLVLNNLIKPSPAYQWIVSVIGGGIALISVGTIPFHIAAAISKHAVEHTVESVGFVAIMIKFAKSKIVGILRSAILKAIVYVAGIWLLEKYFGTFENGLSQIASIFTAFAPVVIMLICIGLILKSAKL